MEDIIKVNKLCILIKYNGMFPTSPRLSMYGGL